MSEKKPKFKVGDWVLDVHDKPFQIMKIIHTIEKNKDEIRYIVQSHIDKVSLNASLELNFKPINDNKEKELFDYIIKIDEINASIKSYREKRQEINAKIDELEKELEKMKNYIF